MQCSFSAPSFERALLKGIPISANWPSHISGRCPKPVCGIWHRKRSAVPRGAFIPSASPQHMHGAVHRAPAHVHIIFRAFLWIVKWITLCNRSHSTRLFTFLIPFPPMSALLLFCRHVWLSLIFNLATSVSSSVLLLCSYPLSYNRTATAWSSWVPRLPLSALWHLTDPNHSSATATTACFIVSCSPG